MEEDIKKKLTKNWFKILQDMICNEIGELENKRSLNLATSVGIVLAEQLRQN